MDDQQQIGCRHEARQVECYPPALFAKAFRGELAHQDPNDEPTSVLFGRIRNAGAGKAPQGRCRRRERAA